METITIDLGASRNGLINESFLRMFGWGVQAILRSMFGSSYSSSICKGQAARSGNICTYNGTRKALY